jgi:hypothetical protein
MYDDKKKTISSCDRFDQASIFLVDASCFLVAYKIVWSYIILKILFKKIWTGELSLLVD